MCGRFVQATPSEVIAEIFGLEEVPPLAPRFNVAPTQPAAVVRTFEGKPQLVFMRWGLVPAWAKDPSIGNRLINARAETLGEKPAFRQALLRRRCVVPVTGFYEWRGSSKGKQPYFIRLKGGMPMVLAGLWEVWRPQEGPPLESFTIITTQANSLLAPLHDRMPAVLPQEGWRAWLDPGLGDASLLLPWLTPAPEWWLEFFPVSRAVNNPAHDAPDCLTPEVSPDAG